MRCWFLPCAAVAVLALCSCDRDWLTGVDDGDAGSAPSDAAADAGEAPQDAGTLDAGDPVDGGADAGPEICEWGENPPVPFACEGDEDWCDPPGDTAVPERDLLAIWSRVEGNDIVFQVRYAAAPYRNYPRQGFFLVFQGAQGALAAGFPDDPSYLCESRDPPTNCVTANIDVSISWYRGHPDPSLGAYPPRTYGTNPDLIELDRCTARLGRTLPLLELRLPCDFFCAADGRIHYAMLHNFGTDFDASWPTDSTGLLESRDGRSSDEDDLASFCDLRCESVLP